MNGELPLKLNSITFSGKGVKVLGVNVLQGVRSPKLSCTFRNTGITRLSSGLFRNAGRTRNISVNVRDNLELQYVENPSSGGSPGMHRKTFLVDLKVVGNKLSCDCDIGY